MASAVGKNGRFHRKKSCFQAIGVGQCTQGETQTQRAESGDATCRVSRCSVLRRQTPHAKEGKSPHYTVTIRHDFVKILAEKSHAADSHNPATSPLQCEQAHSLSAMGRMSWNQSDPVATMRPSVSTRIKYGNSLMPHFCTSGLPRQRKSQ